MSITRRKLLQTAAAAVFLAASSLPAFAAEVAGVKFPETVSVAGHDLKLNGATPFVDAGRIFGLACGIDEVRTEARLRSAAKEMGVAPRETEAWIAAFYHVQGQRLRRQAACLDAGIETDNKLDARSLNDYDRGCLRAAFEQSRNVQRRLALDFGG